MPGGSGKDTVKIFKQDITCMSVDMERESFEQVRFKLNVIVDLVHKFYILHLHIMPLKRVVYTMKTTEIKTPRPYPTDN